MGQVHQLIEVNGIEIARNGATSKLERQCVETAFAIMTDEVQRTGFMHAGFAMTALPHKAIAETKWLRHGAGIKLLVESGSEADDDMTPVGIPFGSIARMILLYLQTEAVRTGSREIELGRSMNKWLATMGINTGGKTYKLVREQARRLSLCRLTFYKEMGNQVEVTNGSFVRNAIIPTRDADQMPLWRDVVTLDEGFFRSLLDHPMPVREAAIREIGGRSQAIDIYVWLAYRLHQLKKATPISWGALNAQFGGSYTNSWHFKNKFKEPLQLALAAYPEARVIMDESGLILHPSAPPVPDRKSLSFG